MYHHRVLIRFSYLLLAALASPSLAKEDCPMQPGQIEYKNFRWESVGYVISAGVGVLDQVEKQGLNLSECTIEPRTTNPKILRNRNWYLYKCGNHQLVKLETYIRCEENLSLIGGVNLFGNSWGQSLNQAVNNFVCSMNPVVAYDSWFFRDKKGIDFPLSENDKLLGWVKKNGLHCSTNKRLETSRKVYEVGGVNSRSDSKYIVIIQKTDIYRFVPIPERVPTL